MSLPFSLVSLALASAKAYHHQRLDPFADPNPPLVKTVALVFPSFLFITATYVTTWAVLFSFNMAWALLMVAATLAATRIFYKIFHIEGSLRRSAAAKSTGGGGGGGGGGIGVGGVGGNAEDVIITLKWNSLFTSILTPCVVGSHKSNLLAVSSLSTALCLKFWLLCTSQLIWHGLLPKVDGGAPIFYCSSYESVEPTPEWQVCLRAGTEPVECGQHRLMRFCREDVVGLLGLGQSTSCQPGVRVCGESENPATMMFTFVIPVLNSLLFVCIFLCCLLQVLSDYVKVFAVTRLLTCGRGGYLHRSVFVHLVTMGKDEKLRDILCQAAKNRSLPTEINRHNCEGDTPLHIACRHGDAASAEVLLDHGANPVEKNVRKRTPVHLAAIHGRASCLRLLSGKITESEINAPDHQDKSPLYWAIRNDHEECARTLLTMPKAGKKSPAWWSKRDCDMTLLHLAVLAAGDVSVDTTVVVTENLRRNRSSVENRENVLLSPDSRGRTPLHYAARAGRRDNLRVLTRHLLEQARSHPIEEEVGEVPPWWPADHQGETPLHLAVLSGDKESCEVLIDYLSHLRESSKAVFTKREEKPTSLLGYAVLKDSPGACKILLEMAGEAPREVQEKVFLMGDTTEEALLRLAVELDRPKVLKVLVRSNRTTSTEQVEVLMHLCIQRGRVECIKILAAKEVSPGLSQQLLRRGGRLLRKCVEADEGQILELLLDVLGERGFLRWSLARKAVAQGSRTCLRSLLEREGVSLVMSPDGSGGGQRRMRSRLAWTLVRQAAEEDRPAMLDFLLDHQRAQGENVEAELAVLRCRSEYEEEEEEDSQPLLHYVATSDRLECFKILVRNGAASACS